MNEKDEQMTSQIPFYKKKWFVGTRIQKDFITYIVFAAMFSQFAAFSHFSSEELLVNEVYHSMFRIVSHVILFGYFFYGFWLSNCMAGPLYRLKRHMDDVANGKTDAEIQFRKNDYGADLAEAFNAVIQQRLNQETQKQ